MTQTQQKNASLNILEQIKQAVKTSWEKMQQTWNKSLEEASLNPKATYQKPQFHQAEFERGILYELPRSKPQKALIDEEKLAQRIYRPSQVAVPAIANVKPPRNTLYEVTYHTNKTDSLYGSPDNQEQLAKYPKPLKIGYHQNNGHPNNFSKSKPLYASSKSNQANNCGIA